MLPRPETAASKRGRRIPAKNENYHGGDWYWFEGHSRIDVQIINYILY